MSATASDLPAPRGSSFYVAMRILPRARRQAMFDIYGFCRAVDDIADDCARDRGARRTELEAWRRDIDAMFAGDPPAHLRGLARSVAAYDLQRRDFLAVIDGMEMDVERTVGAGATDWATLDLYCDRVASAVGRLSVRVFGMNEVDGIELAHHLGRALQLTNILRDLDEDAEIDRLYLPIEALRHAGVTATAARAVAADAKVEEACQLVASVAESHFEAAQQVFDRTPRRARRTPRIMGEAYRFILGRLYERGWAPPRTPLKLGKAKLILIVARCFLA